MMFKLGATLPVCHENFVEMTHDMGLEQVVREPTRLSNVLDLVLTNSPTLIPRLEIIPGIHDYDIVFLEYNTMLEVKKSATRSIFLNNRANWEQTKEETRELHCDHPHPGDATAEGLWKKLKVTLKKQYQQRQQDKRNLSPGSPWKSGSCLEDRLGSTKR